jgi:dihydrofolate reductase
MTKRMGSVFCDLTISADGYSAGLNHTEERPFGDDGGDGSGDKLHAWMFEAPEENRAEVDQMTAYKAFIMGRNMFGPVRGEWDRQWKGWWGDNPPFHGPVFVLTHYPRDPQPMDGGTTYHFVTDGIESALSQAREAAGDGDVSIHGGATTINQYLAAGLIQTRLPRAAPRDQPPRAGGSRGGPPRTWRSSSGATSSACSAARSHIPSSTC